MLRNFDQANKSPALKAYTQVTSKCRIQSDATALSSRKITQWNSRLLPSCLTMKSALWHAPEGRVAMLYMRRYRFSI